MGAINPSKMPKKKVIKRKDDPNSVEMYAFGGDTSDKSDSEEESSPITTRFTGQGGSTPGMGTSGMGRMYVGKKIGKDLDLEGYLEGQATRRGSSTSGKVTGAGFQLTKRFKDGGEVWDKARPKGLGKPQKLSPAKKASAKAAAKRAGRPYPNLIDNMRAAKGK